MGAGVNVIRKHILDEIETFKNMFLKGGTICLRLVLVEQLTFQNCVRIPPFYTL